MRNTLFCFANIIIILGMNRNIIFFFQNNKKNKEKLYIIAYSVLHNKSKKVISTYKKGASPTTDGAPIF